ncbi:cytokinesis regulator (Byr4) [Blumeria hordei DH14]|uniref:Cytokinesis regulator (Byr4) n=1 Tax=Blumeria graminis f. sp. hordei (strain DH14) TaxID=546991 RepID=N1JEC1_BLUG1|nr:cytokinesis regulator (Byr4) [Blumeria hordei DH14]
MQTTNVLAEERIESWDDDDLDIQVDDFTFRSASIATTIATHRRDSVSSRRSIRSDVESNHGDEERQVLLPGDDETSINDAIATAKRVGIPLPQGIPTSALLGGTIKRLGARKIKKFIQDDWDDGDIEFPSEGIFKIKKIDSSNFPDVFGLDSSVEPAPNSPKLSSERATKQFSKTQLDRKSNPPSELTIHRLPEDAEDENFWDGDTIKVPKSRQASKILPFTTPHAPLKEIEPDFAENDYDQDFQFQSLDGPLKLSTRKDIPKTPISLHDESDEWGEGGSLGTRHGGKRNRISDQSSSTAALSPSASSSLTNDSEDEATEGLVLPHGPIPFQEILKRRQQYRSQEYLSRERNVSLPTKPQDDFLSDLDIGHGDVFDTKKLTLNRNIKVKTAPTMSPAKPKAAVSLKFTNKPSAPNTSRLPRPLGNHDRVPSSLEPVSESGGPVTNLARRSRSRLGSHMTHASINAIVNSNTLSNNGLGLPSTPFHRDLMSKPSCVTLRKETTTTNSAHMLKLKRSMPIIRSFQSATVSNNTMRSERYSGHSDSNRTNPATRPKTPIERGCIAENSLNSSRTQPLPFLPAGAINSQSHHVLSKNLRKFHRHDSESSCQSLERGHSSRAVSRSTLRSPSPRRRGVEDLAREAATKRLLTKPVRRRNFGNGGELDAFDDLPTSRESEQKYVKDPVGRGPPKLASMRRKTEHHNSTSAVSLPDHPTLTRSRDDLPRFARDTNASRLARENTLAQRTPLTTLTNHWKAKSQASSALNPTKTQPPKPKKKKCCPQKPQLIKPLGNSNNSKSVKGMLYNPRTYRWEGNEFDLSPFDAPSSPSSASIPSFPQKEPFQIYREKETTTPRPALIQHVQLSQNVQIVGGMIFDPQRMCWLKVPSQRRKVPSCQDKAPYGIEPFDEDDEDDVFKDVPDLEDSHPGESSVGGAMSDGLKEDFIVGEEFDVGPEFIRRQREEEQRWKRKVEKWIQADTNLDRGNESWRWNIRDMVMNYEI